MSKELIQEMRMVGRYYADQTIAKLLEAGADALEAKAAPVGELREAFEAWAKSQGENVKTDGADYYFATTSQLYAGWKAGAAYQRVQQPQSAEAVATILKPDLEADIYDEGPYMGREDWLRLQDLPPGTKLYTTPQPSAVPDDHTEQVLAMVQDGWKLAVDNVAGYAHLYNSGSGIIHEIRAEHARLLAAAPSAPKADDPVKVQLLEALGELLAVAEQYDLPLSDPERIAARAAIAAARQEGGKV